MRHILLLLIHLLAINFCVAQLTGNTNVRDANALSLDSMAIVKLIGEWECIRYEEEIRKAKETDENPDLVIELRPNGIYTERRKNVNNIVLTAQDGNWQINNNTIEISARSKNRKHRLEGKWVIYNLTDNSLTFVKILTSSGDWRKEFKFKRMRLATQQ